MSPKNCPNCGYDLRGHDLRKHRLCPECGHDFVQHPTLEWLRIPLHVPAVFALSFGLPVLLIFVATFGRTDAFGLPLSPRDSRLLSASFLLAPPLQIGAWTLLYRAVRTQRRVRAIAIASTVSSIIFYILLVAMWYGAIGSRY